LVTRQITDTQVQTQIVSLLEARKLTPAQQKNPVLI